jgi:phage terminase Nu1 subunit (DNA packaging protein)
MAKKSRHVSAEELAEVLDLTARRVNQIAQEGIIFQRESDGNYDLVFCVEQYYKDKFIPTEGRVNYETEKALHEKAKREQAEIKLALMQKKVFSEEEIKLVIVPMFIAFRNRILAIAPTIAEKLVGKSAKEIETMIDKTHKEALSELSDYDQIDFGSSEYEAVLDEPEDSQTSD